MKPNAEIPVSVELLRMIFDLPPSYQIVGAATRQAEVGRTVRLIVAAQDLPVVDADGARHELSVVYRRVDTVRVALERIDVHPVRVPDVAIAASTAWWTGWDGEDGG